MPVPHANTILRFDTILPAIVFDPDADFDALDVLTMPDLFEDVLRTQDALDFECVPWSEEIDAELAEAAWAEDLADADRY